MRKGIALLVVPVLCVSLVACNAQPAQQIIQEVSESPKPSEGVQAAEQSDTNSVTRVVCYPEGSDQQSADYILTYTLPQFSAQQCATEMNAAVALYEEELIERVASERVPYADRVEGEPAPYTTVEAEVSESGEYTNIVFTEEFGYSEQDQEVFCFTLVLNGKGEEVSFYEVSGLYAPEDIVAQQVWNIMDREDPASLSYYGDLSTEDVKLGLDLYNGYSVTDEGYTVYFQPGVLADTSMGTRSFTFSRHAVYPDFVGEVISEKAYEALSPALSALACACGVNFYNYYGEEMDAYTATTFMSRLYRSEWTYENGFAYVEANEYEKRFALWLDLQLPSDLSTGNGTVLDGEKYRVPEVMIAEYGLRLDYAQAEDNTVVITGMLYSGVPGTAEASELSAVTITLKKADTAAEYVICGFEID